MSFQKILVAIDDSPLAQFAFTAALELASSIKATIMLLHCLPPELVGEPTISPVQFETGLQPSLMINDYQTQQILMERRIEETQALLKRYYDEAMSHGVPTYSDHKIGEAGSLLCEVAQDWGADLIVVGRRGRTGLVEALLGSVSNHVVHNAPCSVLVIQQVEPEPPTEAVIDPLSAVINPPSSQGLT